ncbi:unnamed protein product [Caenorhabditis angaria]|uniref:Uncharacterized protein n=1 Tax=Caenorhabditis angaria TaxID=860376 RepID=A0A9P1I1U4_9PELO|nr:unnamed protein product [Caenorhabditis angaria]
MILLFSTVRTEDEPNLVIRCPIKEITKYHVTQLQKLSESSTLKFCWKIGNFKEFFKLITMNFGSSKTSICNNLKTKFRTPSKSPKIGPIPNRVTSYDK